MTVLANLLGLLSLLLAPMCEIRYLQTIVLANLEAKSMNTKRGHLKVNLKKEAWFLLWPSEGAALFQCFHLVSLVVCA